MMRVVVVSSENRWLDLVRAVFSPADMVSLVEMAQVLKNPALIGAADACFVAETNTTIWTVDAVKQISAGADTPVFVLTDGEPSQWDESVLFAGAQQIFRKPLRSGMIQLAISRCPRARPVEQNLVGSAARNPGVPGVDGAGRNQLLVQCRDFTALLARGGLAGSRGIDEYLGLLRDALRCNRLMLYVPDRGPGQVSYRCGYAKGVDAAEFASFRLSRVGGVILWVIERGTLAWRQRLRLELSRDAAAAREMNAFGAELAVPLFGATGMAGLLLVGPRISGQDYSEDDAIALYRTMEQFVAILEAATSANAETNEAKPAVVAEAPRRSETPELESDPHGIHNLLQRAGEQLSNEFGNALTPLDILVQTVRQPATSRAELEKLGTQVAVAMHRLRRRVDDLSYLTKAAIIPEQTNVSAILRFTRERLDDWLEAKHLKRVVWLNEFSSTPLVADERALALAIAELVMNGVEACDGKQVTVTAEDVAGGVSFRVRNSGAWATTTNSARHRPFVSTKSTGVGLGIEVASRVAANHGGSLQVGPVSQDQVEAVLTVPHGSGGGDARARAENRIQRAS